MSKIKKLNILDLVKHKKDFLWNKNYFGQFEKNDLVDSILYGEYFEDRKLINVFSAEKRERTFMNTFVNYFSVKRKIRYFVRELDEIASAQDIEFMQSCGFHRYNRNYCFDYGAASDISWKNKRLPKVYCRELKKEDLNVISEFDQNAQILEYRDRLYRSKKFFKNNFTNVYVFTLTVNLDELVAFAIKRGDVSESIFEFVLQPSQDEILFECLEAFAERYVHYEKNNDNFKFVVNENLKNQFENLQKKYKLINCSQLLILEGAPREKVPIKKPLAGLELVSKLE